MGSARSLLGGQLLGGSQLGCLIISNNRYTKSVADIGVISLSLIVINLNMEEPSVFPLAMGISVLSYSIQVRHGINLFIFIFRSQAGQTS